VALPLTMSFEKSPEPQYINSEYHHALRTVYNAPLRSLLAFGAFAGTITTSLALTIPLINVLDLAISGDAPNRNASLLDPTGVAVTPGLVLGGATMGLHIPASLAVERLLYGRPLGSVCSVENRFRWRWLLSMVRRVAPVTVAVGCIFQLLRPAGPPQLTRRSLVITLATVVSLTLQSAAEEFAVRGLLQRVTASWFKDPGTAFWASTAFATAFFAGIHMSRDVWLNFYYVLSGVCASLMTRWTGGLEASVLVHTANNLALMLPIMMADNLDAIKAFSTGKSIGAPLMSLAALNMVGLTWYIKYLAKREKITARQPLPDAGA
jgi:membrane protease YdiL (CAAX protease family)